MGRESRRGREHRRTALIGVRVFIALHILYWMFFETTLTPLEPSEIIQTFGQGLVNAGAILSTLSTVATLVFAAPGR